MILYLRIETVKNQLQTLLGTCTHTYLVHIGEYPPPPPLGLLPTDRAFYCTLLRF